MKYVNLMLAVAFLASCAPGRKIVKQNYPTPFEFSVVDSLPATKDQLYVKAFEWISRSYGSAKAVVDMHDKEAGKIIGKAIIDYKEYPYGEVQYLISVDVRDGKYRCILSNFVHNPKVSVTRYGNMPGVKYGELGQEKVIRKSDSGSKFEDKSFYGLKNYVMDYSKVLLSSMKEKMETMDTF